MRGSSRIRRYSGLMLHMMIGALLLMAGLSKFSPAEALGEMTGYGFSLGQMRMIGVGELITALLLLIPRTRSLGILLASSLWGGIICIHMANQEPYAVQSVMLLLSWAGAYLRDPQTLGSFAGPGREDAAGMADQAMGHGRSAADLPARHGPHAVGVMVRPH